MIEDVQRAVREHREIKVVLRSYKKTGTPFWHETLFAPVRGIDDAVTHYVALVEDVTERRTVDDVVAFHATHDALTGLPNRKHFEMAINASLSHATDDDAVGVLVLDIKNFGVINDSLGRGAGDELLKIIGQRLEAGLGDADALSHLGGDEFGWARAHYGVDESLQDLALELSSVLSAPAFVGGQEIDARASIGIARGPSDGRDARTLLLHAEAASRACKASGGAPFMFFDEKMDPPSSTRLALERRLRVALEREEFVLHYQPQVDARTGKVVGVEALVRWNDPNRGIVGPGEFIGAAETSGLIVPLGAWVLAEACRQNRIWQDAGLEPFPIAVNVSMAQFQRPDFGDHIADALKHSELSPACLELEITETLVMENINSFIATLARLKRIGVSISIDDFGTGYSSLNYLKRLPIDKLKIDQSFVRDVAVDPDDAAICRSIIDVAHNLRLQVIAEGVETVAQASFLERYGCDHLQGYLMCRPVPPTELTEKLLEGRGYFGPQYRLSEERPDSILVVDDDEDSLAAVNYALKALDIPTLFATTASQAFEIMATESIAVVIADDRMPGMGGTELLSRLRRIYPDTVRILMSAHAEFDTLTHAVNDVAAYRFIMKPWDADVLREAVRGAFAQHQLQREVHQLRARLQTPKIQGMNA